ncbi:MAG: hypothetical protein IT492_09745 [Gammaproteobacteria bacterium]|nr:hypothetical protein [Gammaproteobacteria bacterium]
MTHGTNDRKGTGQTNKAGATSIPSVTADHVAALAAAVGLPLSPQRVAVVQPILAVWLADSAALNSLMQAEAHREVVPVTVLRHTPSDAGDC